MKIKRLIPSVLAVVMILSACSSRSQKKTVLGYLTDDSDEPLIVYSLYGDEIAKDSEVNRAYVIKNGKCRLYYCDTTLGELSKMTDSEILEMLEDRYQEGLREAISIWKSDDATNQAILRGDVKLYEPRFFDITGCLLTDDTGNEVVGELLFFPKAGINGPYVIEYPQHSDPEDSFMNYYGTQKDSSSPWDIKFDVVYFNTGYGTVSDIEQINNVYYITEDTEISGTVYDSDYYGFTSTDCAWTYNEDAFCFRVNNAKNFNLKLDSMDSRDVSYIDPTENNIWQISKSYYNAYYNSFTKFPTED